MRTGRKWNGDLLSIYLFCFFLLRWRSKKKKKEKRAARSGEKYGERERPGRRDRIRQWVMSGGQERGGGGWWRKRVSCCCLCHYRYISVCSFLIFIYRSRETGLPLLFLFAQFGSGSPHIFFFLWAAIGQTFGSCSFCVCVCVWTRKINQKKQTKNGEEKNRWLRLVLERLEHLFVCLLTVATFSSPFLF